MSEACAGVESLEERLYRDNRELNRLEYETGRIHLWSRPRQLGLVLGNGCNLRCRHCYQARNGDHLLRPVGIGASLRREFAGLYPYLSTLRILGGEVLALAGFEGLVEDVSAASSRPLLSISSNLTLLDDRWAERMVRTPFRTVTVSLDGAQPETVARLRGGTDLEVVLGGLRRLAEWKRRLASPLPFVDAFFVLMRSNFREVPAFLELLKRCGVVEATLQTLEINAENSAREPALATDECIRSEADVRELHDLLGRTLERERGHFRMIRVCGLESLFEAHGLDAGFLKENRQGLYPDSDDLAGGAGFECCPNPWTTLFVTETGSAHLCFLSEEVGNLYATPLADLWNSPRAVAKRSLILAGRYSDSGCSSQWCGWRDGQAAPSGAGYHRAMETLTALARDARSRPAPPPADAPVDAVRRAFSLMQGRMAELESRCASLEQTDNEVHRFGQQYIDELEGHVRVLQARIGRLERERNQPALWLRRGLARWRRRRAG